LESLAHESLVVPAHADQGIVVPEFDVVSHLVSSAAGETVADRKSGHFAVVRERLARMLDTVGDADESH
ncbi:MAG: hypothetical protein ACRDV3_05000, partial [Acidothermaceae bacterium]